MVYRNSGGHKVLAIPGLFHTEDQSVKVDAQRETWYLKENYSLVDNTG